MGIYEKYFLPKILHLLMQSPELTRLRKKLVPAATGKVLEVGIGSGLNLPFYAPGVQLVGVDPSAALQVHAQDMARQMKLPVEFITQACEDLPLGDNTFDTALVTWTLCTIPNPAVALDEIRRLLKPDGKLIFIEHGRSKEAVIASWQDRINPLWKLIGGGCNLNRRPDQSLLAQGFKFDSITEGYIKGPRIATYNYYGVAAIA